MTDTSTDQPGSRITRLPARKTGRSAERKRGNPLTPRIKTAVEAMVWQALPLDRAAQLAKITSRALRYALRKPEVLAFYKAELTALRSAAQAGNLTRVLTIRDDDELRATAAGNKVIIDAASYIDAHGQERAGGININIGIANQQTSPGYMIDTSRYDPTEVARILSSAGSRESLLDDAQIGDVTQGRVAQEGASMAHARGEKLIAHQPAEQAKPLIEHEPVSPSTSRTHNDRHDEAT